MVSDCWDGEEWYIDFRWSFGEEEMKEWEDLLGDLDRYQMGGGMRSSGNLKSQEYILPNQCLDCCLSGGSPARDYQNSGNTDAHET